MPTFTKTTVQENRKIFLDSQNSSLNLSKSHLFYYLDEPINVLPGHYIFLSVLDAYIPVSFYQQKNVVLSGSIGGSNFSFTIPDGTYTANEMVTTVNSLFTAASLTCTMSYSKITNKFTFTAGSGVTIVLNSNSFLNQFGFTVAQHTGTTTLTSNKVVDLMTIKNIYIKLNNLSIANSKNGKSTKVVAKVPITEGRSGIVNYLAHSNISSEIYDTKLDLIEIILCDDNDEEVDFNNIPFSLSLGVVFNSRLEYTNSMKTNDEEVDYINST
jgi:hypothetical protein